MSNKENKDKPKEAYDGNNPKITKAVKKNKADWVSNNKITMTFEESNQEKGSDSK